MISTKDLGEELAKISFDLAKRDNATYAELRLVNTRSEAVTVVNENPASEEAGTIGGSAYSTIIWAGDSLTLMNWNMRA